MQPLQSGPTRFFYLSRLLILSVKVHNQHLIVPSCSLWRAVTVWRPIASRILMPEAGFTLPIRWTCLTFPIRRSSLTLPIWAPCLMSPIREPSLTLPVKSSILTVPICPSITPTLPVWRTSFAFPVRLGCFAPPVKWSVLADFEYSCLQTLSEQNMGAARSDLSPPQRARVALPEP